MAAANTDNFRKGTNNFATTLSSGMASGDSSLSLSSTTNLPTDTAIDLVIDRVNSSGALTPTLTEYVKGVVSGTTVINLVRGLGNSTAQAHASGAVVESVWTSEAWNDAAAAILTQHTQAGAHQSVTNTGGLSNAGGLTNTGGLSTDTMTASGLTTTHAITNASGVVQGVVDNLKNPYKFSVYLTAAQNVGTAPTLVQFNAKNFDTSSNVDITTNKGRFTVPIAGFYQINARVATTSVGSGTGVVIYLYKNGSEIAQGDFASLSSGTSPSVSISDIFQLAASDYLEVYVGTGAAAKAVDVSTNFNNVFSGFLVSAT